MEFWFVRHGETVDNANHVLQGQQPGKLSEQGISQAKLTGIRLAKETFSEVICSDLGRCKETLECIMTPFKSKESVKVTYSPLIRERGFGIFENKPTIAYRDSVQKSGVPFKDYKPKGGESYKELQQRADQFAEFLEKKAAGKTNNNSADKVKKEVKPNESQNQEESKRNETQVVPQNQNKPEKKEESIKNPKILVISHKGFLTELFDAIQARQKNVVQNVVAPTPLNNCSITIVKVVELSTGDVSLEFTQRNDISHLTL